MNVHCKQINDNDERAQTQVRHNTEAAIIATRDTIETCIWKMITTTTTTRLRTRDNSKFFYSTRGDPKPSIILLRVRVARFSRTTVELLSYTRISSRSEFIV